MHSGRLMHIPAFPDAYKGPTYPNWIQQCRLLPTYIDAVAVYVDSAEGSKIHLSVINRHPTADWIFKLEFDDFGER